MESAKLLIIGFIFVAGSQALPQFPSGYRYNPQYCRDTLTGRQLYVGEVFTRPGQCVRVQCLGTLQLWEDTCKIPVALKGDCHVLPPTETNLAYPKCCPLYECKTFTVNPEGELEQTNTYDHAGNLRKSHLTEVIVINKDRLAPNFPERPTVQPNVRKYSI